MDALAAALATRLQRVTLPLARAAAAVCSSRAWFELGHSRAEDFARERLGRTGRWLRDLAALGRALETSLQLQEAVEGADGRPPLGAVAAVAIARFEPAADALSSWIALGRSAPVRELRRRLAHARAADSLYPLDGNGLPDDLLHPPDRIIEWIAQTSPELLHGPALRERAARPWNRRHLESLGISLDAPCGAAPDATERDSRRDPPPEPTVEPLVDPRLDEDREPLLRLQIDLPAPVAAAFHEIRRLHDRVVGHRTTTVDFTDALVAEARATGLPVRPEVETAFDRLCATRVIDDPAREAEWNHRRRAGSSAAGDLPASERFPPAGAPEPAPSGDVGPLISRADELVARACALQGATWLPGPVAPAVMAASAAAAALRLQALVLLEQELRRMLGELLAELRARRAWHALGFCDLRHYAEERLGISRSSAEDAALLARELSRLPQLRAAFEADRITPAAALRVVRVLAPSRRAVPPELERYWAEHAESTTVRRLDDERLLLRERDLLRTADPIAPVPDAEWSASLARAPGASAERLRHWARLAAERSTDAVPLLLVLPFSRGADFLGALAAAAECVRTYSAEPLDPYDARWLGLLSLLTSYAATHDHHRGPIGVFARDGWRCRAPGCTSHSNLEDHHVQYRSHGGDDSPENRVTLCRYHHQRGEHGGRMRVVGRAPLDLEFTVDGATYRNERRTDRPAGPPR
ncbi:MAG: HNH endonuclease [Acidobacteria bacterium]|nr:HNH endonuclease [Acidobacteriota bacterium]